MLSIIIPTFNCEDVVGKLLKSVLQSDTTDDFEVLVVDDCSDDRTQEIVGEFPDVRLITQDRNRGSATARNTGFAAAKADILLFFDADVVVERDTVRRLVELLGEDGVDIAQGIYSKNSLTKGLVPEYKALREYHAWDALETREATVFKPTFLATTREVFEAAGGFDPSIRGALVEDYELGYRLLEQGRRIVVDKRIALDHHFPPTLRKLASNYFSRVFSWIVLFSRRRQFDNVGATPRAGVTAWVAFLSLLSVSLVALHPAFIAAPLALSAVFAILQASFFRFVLREHGFAFTAGAVAVDYVLWLVVAVASLIALPSLAAALLSERRSAGSKREQSKEPDDVSSQILE